MSGPVDAPVDAPALTAVWPTLQEARLLATLRCASPAVVSQADLLAAIWPDGVQGPNAASVGRDAASNNLRSLVGRLRSKLLPGVSMVALKGSGYQLLVPGSAWR